MVERGVPTVGGGADAESGGNVARDAAGQQVLRDRRVRMFMQLRGIPRGEFFIDGVNALTLIGAFLRLAALK